MSAYRYSTWTRAERLKRIADYAERVGCGCYNSPEKCQREPNCARADFKRLVASLRRPKGRKAR